MSQAEHTRLPVVTHVCLRAAKTKAAMLGCQVGLGYSYVAGGQASPADLCSQNPGPVLYGNLEHQTCSVPHLIPEIHTLMSTVDTSGPCTDLGPHGALTPQRK